MRLERKIQIGVYIPVKNLNGLEINAVTGVLVGLSTRKVLRWLRNWVAPSILSVQRSSLLALTEYFWKPRGLLVSRILTPTF